MKRIVYKMIKSAFAVLGKRRSRYLVARLVNAMGSDLLTFAYQERGILNHESQNDSGESYVIEDVLGKIRKASPVMFDVGANVGDYSRALRAAFPSAAIYAFEPNHDAFDTMKMALEKLNIDVVQKACSSKSEHTFLNLPADDKVSAFGTLYNDCIQTVHSEPAVARIEIETTTIDEFCREHNIVFIDFLKIDTEGHELEVLKGAAEMLANNSIGAIQFEFNEMNVFSKVFLRDFYSALPQYDMYRLKSGGLIDIKEYNTSNEIFKFQNILAINRCVPNSLANQV